MNHDDEWLEADGRGGFASGTVSGERTRRYHAILLAATTPPTGRMVLVNGFEAWVNTSQGHFAISSQRYTPNVVFPDGAEHIESFSNDPWPRWILRLPDGTRLEQQLFVPHGRAVVAIAWRLIEPQAGTKLFVRPLISGRDYHQLHHKNPGFNFAAKVSGEAISWAPYPGVPRITAFSNGNYQHEPTWYRNFLYLTERERGLDDTEDLASPGTFAWELSQSEAIWVLTSEKSVASQVAATGNVKEWFCTEREKEQQRRAKFTSPVIRAADAYLVDGNHGRTIIAGYPWFTDWGRDTFIALRGLCLATGRLDDAWQILLGWTDSVSEGMLPNRFPDQPGQAEYNSVDASLWFIVTAGELLDACKTERQILKSGDAERLQQAIEAILTGYWQGTRFGIRLDSDGLLACGQPGTQLTWMDAKVGDWVVTPRIGKPVEIQALWLNALSVAQRFSSQWKEPFERGREALAKRFWNPDREMLYDVVDVNHRPGEVDATFRPNQIFTIGGLPLMLLDKERARRIVDVVEQHLWTPTGLRSLAPGESGYAPHYDGGPRQRDGDYHQGTVWPWLAGPFVEAWLRVRDNTDAAKIEVRTRFLQPLSDQLNTAGLGHISEIADAEPPHTPRGCPFQAWSLGEFLRLSALLTG